jgi:nucleotide-binding universal stress UspA family protein
MHSRPPKPAGLPFVLVVAVDLTDTPSGGYAVDQAFQIVARIPGSQLHVIHVTPGQASRETLGLLRLYVSEKAAALGVTQQSVGVHVREGEAAHEIARLAEELAADLVVVGAHRAATVRKLLVGSTAEQVLASASCPVVVAGPRPRPQPSTTITIQGPCPDCVRARLESPGKAWWCARHSEHHPVLRRHVYAYFPEIPFNEHDSEVSPTGVD